MNIKKFLEKHNEKCNNDNVISSLTFGYFNNYGGQTNIDNNKYMDIQNLINNMSGKYLMFNTKIYKYLDKELSIKNNYKNNKSVLSTTCLEAYFNKNIAFTINNTNSLPINNFPIVNKYHDICYRKTKVYKLKYNLTALFIEEENGNGKQNGNNQQNTIRNIIININNPIALDEDKFKYIEDMVNKITSIINRE